MARKKSDPARAGERSTARERLLASADELFYRRGIRAVGIDEVIAHAGVAKASLYRAFPSKDDLVVAYLEERDAVFWRRWDEVVDAAPNGMAALQGVVTLLANSIEHPDYRGCPFANFASEFPEHALAGRGVIERSKAEWHRRLSLLVDDALSNRGTGLVEAIMLMSEGAFSLSQTAKDGRTLASRALREGFRAMIGNHLASTAMPAET